MRLFWGNSLNTAMGNAYGYSVHYFSTRKALDALGVEASFKSDVAIHIATAPIFKPIPGKANGLFTMYECTTLPPSWPPAIQKADFLIVPCKQNKDLFRQYFNKPIYVCNEGCDTELYQYRERTFPTDRPFRFLWVGAPNLRKGFAHVGQAWAEWMLSEPHLKDKTEIYMKTSGINAGETYLHKPEWNMLIDAKSTPGVPMRDMYYDAHAFLLPSMGEGWGLTLCEAAATGLPCVYTPWSGPVEFMNRKDAYPVHWKFNSVRTMKKMPGKNPEVDHESYAAHPEVSSILQRMRQIYYDYDEALRRARRQSNTIHKHFTWENSARRLCEIIKEYADHHGLDVGEPLEAAA